MSEDCFDEELARRLALDSEEQEKAATAVYGGHYKYDYKGIRLDPYRILKVYGITEAPQQHAIKKLLRCGKSVKDQCQDIDEVIETLQRWKQMIGEDE